MDIVNACVTITAVLVDCVAVLTAATLNTVDLSAVVVDDAAFATVVLLMMAAELKIASAIFVIKLVLSVAAVVMNTGNVAVSASRAVVVTLVNATTAVVALP